MSDLNAICGPVTGHRSRDKWSANGQLIDVFSGVFSLV